MGLKMISWNGLWEADASCVNQDAVAQDRVRIEAPAMTIDHQGGTSSTVVNALLLVLWLGFLLGVGAVIVHLVG